MNEKRTWLKSGKRTRLRLCSAGLSLSLFLTGCGPLSITPVAVPDIGWPETAGQETENADVMVTGFGSLSDEVREQTVPLGTALSELALPDTLEAYVAVDTGDVAEDDEKPDDGDKDKDKDQDEDKDPDDGDDNAGETPGEGDGSNGGDTPGEGDNNGGGTPGEGDGNNGGGTPGEGDDNNGGETPEGGDNNNGGGDGESGGTSESGDSGTPEGGDNNNGGETGGGQTVRRQILVSKDAAIATK